jgi:hypothetical protein
MKQRRRSTALVFSVVGACIGLALMGLQLWVALNVAWNAPLKQVVLVLNAPPIAFQEWCAKAFKHGNGDQMLGYWLLVFPFYWLVLGSIAGLLCCLIVQYREKCRSVKRPPA